MATHGGGPNFSSPQRTPPTSPLSQATAPPPLNRRSSTIGFSSTTTKSSSELSDAPSRRLDFTFTSPLSLPTSGRRTSSPAIFSEPRPVLQPRQAKSQGQVDAGFPYTKRQLGTPGSFLSDNNAHDHKQQQQQQQQLQHQYHHHHNQLQQHPQQLTPYQNFPRTINQVIHQLHPVNLSTKYGHLEESEPRKPLTSIAGSSRCLWPPDSSFWTITGTRSVDPTRPAATSSRLQSQVCQDDAKAGSLLGEKTVGAFSAFHKSHERSDSFKDAAEGLQVLQPKRKARRVLDTPFCKQKNHSLVARHVHKLIQEAVEDGVGELDLSNLDLDDLPSEITDLNYAIVFNERGSFSLSKNRLKLFLSSNLLTTIPMHVFALHNLSVLSLRNNNIESIPAEIGLLRNLVELSVGGNLLQETRF
ncbi:hypothetical protein BGZ94_007247 [Podila epigama]|nr:hypothetical protein BGZ94_007247 [Podila epigama]